MIDFHAHILPFIDDGAKDLTQSMQMLKLLKAQGVSTVVATPHYYDNIMGVEKFFALRNDSFLKLRHNIDKSDECLPKIILGAEVYLSHEIIHNSSIDKLCIGDTRNILIEIPDGMWFDWVCDLTDYLINKKRFKPIIAHFERYAILHHDIERFKKLKELDVIIQVNADSFLNKRMNKTIKTLIKNNMVHIIGSDAHNTTGRKPRLTEAERKIKRKFGASKWEELCNNAKELIST